MDQPFILRRNAAQQSPFCIEDDIAEDKENDNVGKAGPAYWFNL